MGVTIKDIAKLANVSHTTVSRALNNNPLIKLETRERIKQLALQNGYVPNYTAKSLKLDKSFNIGLFFTSIETGTTTSFFHDAIKGCSRIVADKGYNLVVKGIEDYSGDYFQVNSKRFDGIVIVSQSSDDDQFIEYVIQQSIPAVVVNRKIDRHDLLNIIYDDRKGAYTATDYLIKKGHREIGFITGKKEFSNSMERELGYKQALAAHNIPFRDELVENGDFTLKSGFTGTNTLFSRARPTALFCANDEMAVDAIKALNKSGIRVPEECSVIGFDNTSICEFASPELNSINRSIEEMVALGCTKVLRQIDEDKDFTTESTHLLMCQLVERESVLEI